MHESLLSYRRLRYLWVASALALASIAAYAWHRPPEPPNGGTWLGYTLGTIGALLILWLLAFGLRKRAYGSRLGTVQGWLSAHVYLGAALLVVVTLHAGWQVGWNVHTLAYALTWLVVVSGFGGVWLYLRYPAQMSANRAEQTREQMLSELADLDRLCARQAAAAGGDYPELLASNRDRTLIGGGAWALLTAQDRSSIVLPTGPGGAATAQRPQPNPGQERLLDWLGARLSESTDGDRSRLIQELIRLVTERRVLLARLQRDAQIRAWLEAWLYLHVPASFALLAALIAHVVSVFVYW